MISHYFFERDAHVYTSNLDDCRLMNWTLHAWDNGVDIRTTRSQTIQDIHFHPYPKTAVLALNAPTTVNANTGLTI